MSTPSSRAQLRETSVDEALLEDVGKEAGFSLCAIRGDLDDTRDNFAAEIWTIDGAFGEAARNIRSRQSLKFC